MAFKPGAEQANPGWIHAEPLLCHGQDYLKIHQRHLCSFRGLVAVGSGFPDAPAFDGSDDDHRDGAGQGQERCQEQGPWRVLLLLRRCL